MMWIEAYAWESYPDIGFTCLVRSVSKAETIATVGDGDPYPNELLHMVNSAFDNRRDQLSPCRRHRRRGNEVVRYHSRKDRRRPSGRQCGKGYRVCWPGTTVRLHGSAKQRFGTIAQWKWKIGSGQWIASEGRISNSPPDPEEVTGLQSRRYR